MRILIITDSLGSPRENSPVEQIWTYKLMKEHSCEGHVFFTVIAHGLYTSLLDYEQITNINPDVIICQIGVVDCVRRAMPRRLLKIIVHIPGVRDMVQKFVRKHHFGITKRFHFKTTEEAVFRSNIKKINASCENAWFIRIADAGKTMVQKTYDCQNDIMRYNEIIREEAFMIDPYADCAADDYVLEEDGHHLNALGHDLVFRAADAKLKEYLSQHSLS